MKTRLLCLLFLAGFASATFITGDVFQSRGSNSRSLLQAKTPCPVNFEFLNYTIITSKCKGPQYPPSQCCSAFKEFACPYADELNDASNICASTMFTYIAKYGNYPPGLFANECSEGNDGLSCSGVLLKFSPNVTNGNGGSSDRSLSIAFPLMSVLSMALFLC